MSVPPSFSSFPPSFSSFPDLDPGPSKRPSKAPKPSREEHDRKNLKEFSTERSRSKTHKEQGRKHDKDRHKDRLHAESLGAKRDTQNTEEPHRFFYSDRKGDHLNIQYGGLYQGDVPKYRLVGGGRQILGLSDIWVAFRRAGKGVEVGFRDRRRLPGLTDTSSKALLAVPPTRRLLSTDTPSRYEEIDGFIRIPSRRGNQNQEDSYRAITAKEEDNSDSDSSASKRENQSGDGTDSDSDAPGLISHQLTLKDLDQSLTVDPSSIETWLLLLSHTLSNVPITSKNATKARSEISLSILGRALTAHPRNATSKLLLLKNIKAGEDIWHESKVRSEWEAAMKVGGVEIWMEWLEWRLRRSGRGIDSIMHDAVQAIHALGSDEAGQIGKIRIFWRVAVAFRDAGFTERATAMFQAQAELTFEVPQGLYNLPLNTQLDSLEEFWDSEMPRVGDDGAKGWAVWTRNRRSESSPTAAPRLSNVITALDPYRQWSAQEIQDDNKLFLPTRSTNASSESDPYSTVLFADVRSILLSLSSTKAKNAFRLARLAFIGLHNPGFPTSLSIPKDLNWDDRWNCGYLIRPAVFSAIFPSQAEQQPVGADAAAGIVIGRERAYKNCFGPVHFWGYGVFGPLDDSAVQLEKGASQRGVWSANDVSCLDAMFVRRVFEQLRIGNNDYEWDQLALAFEAAIDVKKALKQSKVFLSVSRDSLPHWAAYIQLERMRGRFDDARKVLQTILITSKPASGQNGISQLWWNWAEMEWLAGREEEALNVICTSAGTERGQSSVTFLRTKRALDDAIQAVQNLTLWKDRESWIKLRALFELLTGGDLSSVLGYFDLYLANGRGSVAHESLSVAHLLLVYHYGVKLKNPIPPSVLRERAGKALEEYPSNSVILGLFLEGEKGQGVWGRVRGMLGGSDGKVKDMARRVQEVWMAGWEKGRWIGEVERTRSGLSAAVEHERTKGSPILWRIFLEFEIRVGELGRAKKLLFRAIGECPLVKELYLVAFGPLRSVFSGHELNGLADTMAERGLRLRRGLDEVLEGWEIEGKNSGGDESDESADEIEQNAAELRRRMPY